jgi:hypothetical protein
VVWPEVFGALLTLLQRQQSLGEIVEMETTGVDFGEAMQVENAMMIRSENGS